MILESKKAPIIDPENLPIQNLNWTEISRENWRIKLRGEFDEVCPEIYKKTDLNHEGMPSKEIVDRILNWKLDKGSKGLILQGDTGKGKTRLCWLLIKRLMTKDGVRCRTITDPSFSREYSRRIANGSSDEWMKYLISSPILFIDDFGKAAVTQRYKEQFYDILEGRSNSMKPIIITTQLNKTALMSRFGDDDGKAIFRRIMEFCELIQFNSTTK